MRSLVIFILLVFGYCATAQKGIFDPTLSSVSPHFLRDHTNVSTAGAANNYGLLYDATTFGWKPKNILSVFSSIADNRVLYMSGGLVTGASTLTYDGTVLNVIGASNPKLSVYRSTGGAAYIELENTSNRWQWYCNSTDSGFEPDIANGTFNIRNLANTTIFRFITGSARFEIMTGSTIRVTGKGATGLTIAAYDSNQDLSTLSLGTGLSIAAGTLSNTGVTSVGLSLPSFITVTGSPVTTTGTLTGTLATQTANTIFAGPTTGADAAPTFRTLVGADVANIPITSLSNVDASGATDLQILQFQGGTSTYNNVDLNAALIPIADAGSKYTATNVETALQEIGFTNWTPADGATLALTTKENMILVDGGIDATVSITLNEASITSGTKIYIKGISMTTLTLNSSTGNFIAAGATSGASTLVPTGTFETMLIFNGGTWYQMY